MGEVLLQGKAAEKAVQTVDVKHLRTG